MATKVQIRNWIEAVECKAIKSLKDKFELKKSELEEIIRVEAGLRSLIDEIKKYNEMILLLEEEIFARYESDSRINYNRKYWGSFFKECVSSKIIESKLIVSCKIESQELLALEKKYIEDVRLVEENYATVRATAWSLSPKKAIEYLKELGFDTSSLDTESKQELAVVNVDKRYLFVCGDNK